MENRYSQHVSNYNAFFAVKKTYKDQSEKSVGAHLYSRDSVGNTSTRFTMKKVDKGVEWKEITGTFLDSISGIISSVHIVDAKKLDDGRSIPAQIALSMPTPDGKIDLVTMFVDSKAGDAFLRRVALIDFSKSVMLKPFAFFGDDGKFIEGLTIEQGGVKVIDNYTEFKMDANNKKSPVNKNGLEQFDAKAIEAKGTVNEQLRSAAWKMYFTTLSVFLVDEMQKLPIFGATTTAPMASAPLEKIVYPKDDIDTQDIPF